MSTLKDCREDGYTIDSSLLDLANRKGNYITELSRTATEYYVSRLTLLQRRLIQYCTTELPNRSGC